MKLPKDDGMTKYRFALGDHGEPLPVVAGRYAVYVTIAESGPDDYHPSGPNDRVNVFDLKRGRMQAAAAAANSEDSAGGYAAIVRLVAKASGSVAWSVEAGRDNHLQGPQSRQVGALARDGSVRLLDRAYERDRFQIDLESLIFDAGRQAISWVHSGEQRRAPLP
jgi:hypothetical protein